MRFMCVLMLICGFGILPAFAAQPKLQPAPVNEGSVSGFSGSITGSVTKVGKNGAWFTLKIISAEGTDAPAADEMANITCKPTHTSWATKLKEGAKITIKVTAGDERKLILNETPVGAAKKAETPADGKKKK